MEVDSSAAPCAYKSMSTNAVELQHAPHQVASTQALAMDTASEPSEDEDAIQCRYCLDTETEEGDEMVSPCQCKGGQKYCHLSCLRRWQRSVLVSQPTHPAFYERDERQFVCSVCASAFAYEPPTRQEMMLSFTGPELASLLQIGCLIVTEPRTSAQMADAVLFNSHIPAVATMRHWVGGVYLITDIVSESASDGDDSIIAVNLAGRAIGNLPKPLEDHVEQMTTSSSAIVGRDVTLSGLGIAYGFRMSRYNGQTARIVGRQPNGRIRVQLHSNQRKIIAVKPSNITMLGDEPPTANVTHAIGGPCETYSANSVSVLTNTSPHELSDANVKVGLQHGGLCCTGDLDDVLAVARSDASRRAADNGNHATPEPVVATYWGDARWSRTQLLGELARGSWGVCRAELNDILQSQTDRTTGELSLWKNLIDSDRLIYAPKSEMMEVYEEESDDEEMTEEEQQQVQEEVQEQVAALRQRLREQLLSQQAQEEERRRRVAAEENENSEPATSHTSTNTQSSDA
eukprot:m.333469 g.333469  ORF g.333469 m.333469 type:complete len:516 (+) comp17149_c0_seq1:199-1746(+)